MRLPVFSNRHRGFTLIELMIAVAIIGVLAAIAFPSYQNYVRKARRADAQQFVMNLAQLNQRYFLDNRSYASTVSALATTPSSVSDYYTVTITVDAGPPASFSIAAAPKADQAHDSCGTLAIDNANIKTSTGTSCW